MTDYPDREAENETTLQYSERIARCVTSDLIRAGVVPETMRAACADVVADQVFGRLAAGDEPPRLGKRQQFTLRPRPFVWLGGEPRVFVVDEEEQFSADVQGARVIEVRY